MSSKQQDMSPSHQQKMTKTNKNLVHRYYREVWNHGNMAVINQVFSANHVLDHIPNYPATLAAGSQGIRQLVTTFRAAMPDLELTIEDMVGQWNKVAVRVVLQGTLKGQLLHFAPTGQQITLGGMVIHHILNEKITDTWFSHDFVSTLQRSEPVLMTA